MKNKHFTERERYILERLLKEKRTVKDIAVILDKSERAIYYEKARGQVKQLDYDLKEYMTYKADYAHRDYIEKLHGKEHPLKIGNNLTYVQWLEDMVKNKHYSFYACLCVWSNSGNCNPVCENTLYNYYHKGLFFNLGRNDMPYYKPKVKKGFEERSVALHSVSKRSIEERSQAVLSRSRYGHWEMDTVVGGKNKGKSTLLVLTERQTREEIVKKMPDKKAVSVVDTLDSLEKEMGKKSFKNTFKTITVDNGVEFMDSAGIEKNNRTVLYYCHPYCSSERGSNENQNKLVRRWLPKGSNIDEYSEEYIEKVNHWINSYPRRMFGGLSALQYKERVLQI